MIVPSQPTPPAPLSAEEKRELGEARAYEELGDFEHALAMYLRIAATNPSPVVTMLIARQQRMLGLNVEALANATTSAAEARLLAPRQREFIARESERIVAELGGRLAELKIIVDDVSSLHPQQFAIDGREIASTQTVAVLDGGHELELYVVEREDPLGTRCIAKRLELAPQDQIEIRVGEGDFRVLRVVK